MAREKEKYDYLNRGNNLLETKLKTGNVYLVEGSIPDLNDQSINGNDLLDHVDIYIIRHGEAIHNLMDYYKNIDSKDLTQEEKFIKQKYDKEKRIVGRPYFYVNSTLTTYGRNQARDVYTNYFRKIQNLNYVSDSAPRFYFSSPLDRAIETLIHATTPGNRNLFADLKSKFVQIYNGRGFLPSNEPGQKGGKRIRKSRKKKQSKKNRKTKKMRKNKKTKRYQHGCYHGGKIIKGVNNKARRITRTRK